MILEPSWVLSKVITKGQSCYYYLDKFQRRTDQQRSRFERDLREAVGETVQKVNSEITEYNALLNERIKSIEKILNEIRERRNDQLKQIQGEYRTFERTFHETIKQLERNDRESVRMGEALLTEMEQQRNHNGLSIYLGMKKKVDKDMITSAFQRTTKALKKDRRTRH